MPDSAGATESGTLGFLLFKSRAAARAAAARAAFGSNPSMKPGRSGAFALPLALGGVVDAAPGEASPGRAPGLGSVTDAPRPLPTAALPLAGALALGAPWADEGVAAVGAGDGAVVVIGCGAAVGVVGLGVGGAALGVGDGGAAFGGSAAALAGSGAVLTGSGDALAGSGAAVGGSAASLAGSMVVAGSGAACFVSAGGGGAGALVFDGAVTSRFGGVISMGGNG
jgi:hypothetical protein